MIRTSFQNATTLAPERNSYRRNSDYNAMLASWVSLAVDCAFDEYELQIREEYAVIPAFLFRRKRRAVLEGFLQRPRIFNTQRFFDLYEVRARENLC